MEKRKSGSNVQSRIQGVTRYRVIALEGSDRLEKFFARPGADLFEVFRAVDGRKGEGVEDFNTPLAQFHYDFELSAAEVAIASSHLRVMREFGNESGDDSDVMVVAEDDALLSEDFEEVVQELVRSVRNLQFVILAHPNAEAGVSHVWGGSETNLSLSALSQVVKAESGVRYRCGHFSGILWGAGLYLVTRAAARKYSGVVERIGGLGWFADDWWMFQRFANADVKFLRPNLADWIGDSTFRDVPPQVVRTAPKGVRDRVVVSLALRSRAKATCRAAAATLRDLGDFLDSKGRRR